jgi:tetratricopeptide (TPR) repeat protein
MFFMLQIDALPGKRAVKVLFPALLFVALFAVPAAAYPPAAAAAFNAGVNFTQGHQYEKALASFNQAIAIEPGYFEAWNEKADTLNRLGRYNESLQAVETALTINPDYVKGWINRGAILYNMGRYGDELASYDKAIAADPQSGAAWFNRAYSLAALGRYDESVEAFNKVMVLNPDYPYLRENLRNAIALRDAGKSEEFSRWIYTVVLPFGVVVVLLAAAVWGYARARRKK